MDVSRMLTVIGNVGFSDIAPADVVEKINDVYHDICDLEPWPFLEKTLNLTFDGTNPIPTNWPTDFRSVTKLVDTAATITLMPMRLDEHLGRHLGNLTLKANPLFYFFRASQLYVYPIPSALTSVNNLQLEYLQQEPDLTSVTLSASIVIPARYHRAIVDGVISNLYLDEDDEAQSDYYLSRMDRRLARMRASIWQRSFDRSDTIEVLDEDSDFYGNIAGGEFGSFGPF